MDQQPENTTNTDGQQPVKRRKRGAQPGNKNALKHGFYASHFNPNEISSLKNVRNGLEDEINMLRLSMQRLITLSTAEESDASEWQKTLQALGLASQRLAKLVKTHQELTGEQNLGIETFYEGIREVMIENGWEQG